MKTYKLTPVPNYADVMTIADFVECVQDGAIMDDDGSGYYMIDDKTETDVDVEFHEELDKHPKEMTHVAWYNK